jgi:hypothetical protein
VFNLKSQNHATLKTWYLNNRIELLFLRVLCGEYAFAAAAQYHDFSSSGGSESDSFALLIYR